MSREALIKSAFGRSRQNGTLLRCSFTEVNPIVNNRAACNFRSADLELKSGPNQSFSGRFAPRRSVRIFLAAAFFGLSVNEKGYAQETLSPAPSEPGALEVASVEKTKLELGLLREKIEREEKHLKELKTKQIDTAKQISELEAKAGTQEKKKQELLKAAEELSVRIERFQELIGVANVELSHQKKQFQSRVVALYKSKRQAAQLDYVFHSASGAELSKRSYYLSAIAKQDESYLTRLSRLVSRAQSDSDRLAKLVQERKQALGETESVEAEIKSQKMKKAVLLQEATVKAKEQQRSLEKLQQSAKDMEQVLAQLMGQQQPKSVTSVAPTPVPSSSLQVATLATDRGSTVDSGFDGPGLAALRGKLKFPVEGTAQQNFGVQRHEEFSDLLVRKGIEVFAKAGSEVKSIAKGRVVFAQMLPGYGQVVIVDHGKRFYSLYGRLGGQNCSVGDIVEQGQVVASVGAPDRRGRNFYFELRHLGKAIDPKGYFSVLPKTELSG